MAHVLRLISDAFTTIDFIAANKSLKSFNPKAGKPGETITNTINFWFEEASETAFQTAKQAIERALRFAEFRADNKRGDRVYLEFQPENYAVAYRTELTKPDPETLCGNVALRDDTLGWPWGEMKIEARLIFTHESEWVASAETELELGIEGAAAAIGGVGIRCFHTAAVFGPAATVSFTQATNTIADAGAGFGIFKVGQEISVRGSAANNDGVYTLVTVAAGAITTNEPVTADEAAGANISIYEYLNYVDIAAAQIAGDLPAAVRLEITNTNAAPSLETVWIGLNHSASPLALAHVLELEDSDTGADVGDAATSSAQKRSYSVTTTNAKVTGWTLTSEQLTSADGAFFRVMARFADATDIENVKWQLKLFRSTTEVWSGGQNQFDDTHAAVTHLIRELDTVPLPHFVPENSAPTDLILALWGQSTTGAPVTIVIDALAIMALDGWRVLRSLVGIAQNAVLFDDGITGTVYQEISSEQVTDIIAQGDPLTLWPNKAHRLYFLFHSLTNDTAEFDRTATLSMFYKPRRLTF